MEHLKYHINWFSRISEPSTVDIYNILTILIDPCKDLGKPELSLLGDSSRDLFIPKRWRSLTAIERVTNSQNWQVDVFVAKFHPQILNVWYIHRLIYHLNWPFM